jgi:hypothetical protein
MTCWIVYGSDAGAIHQQQPALKNIDFENELLKKQVQLRGAPPVFAAMRAGDENKHPKGFGINEQTEDIKGESGHGGLFEMLTELGLADQYLHRLEYEEMDMVTLQETLSVSGSRTLLQVLQDAGVDKAGPRMKIVNFLQSVCVS